MGLYNSAKDRRWYINSSSEWQSDANILVGGIIQATSGFFKQSDRRLKSKIKPLEHTLEDILAIPTDSFSMEGKTQIGTIAQDIEKLFPEVVTEYNRRLSEVPERDDWDIITKEENGEQIQYVKVKQVEYEMLSVLALEGLKLLNQKVDNLKKQLNVK